MVEGEQSHAKGVNDPLGLQIQFRHDGCSMSIEFVQHLIRVIQSPSAVVSDVEVVLGSIVYSASATRNQVFLL